jgi:hypothetical protein
MTRHETFIYLFESTGWSGVRWEKLTGIPRQTLSVWKNNDSSSVRPYVLIAMAAVSGKQIKWLNEEMTSCEIVISHIDNNLLITSITGELGNQKKISFVEKHLDRCDRCFQLMTDFVISYNEVKTFLKEKKTDE